MKNKFLYLTLILAGVFSFAILNTACEEDEAKEVCEQEEVCEGEPEVTLCCTEETDCYWTYNGKNYADTDEGIDQLYNDLGCATDAKSGEVNHEILTKLLNLRDRVIEMLQE